jgi:hypothetical protein
LEGNGLQIEVWIFMRHSVIPRHTRAASVEVISGDTAHFLLSVFPGGSDQYRLAQLDDYTKLKRSKFPLRQPLSLHLSARTSSDVIPGTWGFGFWNDPFGLSLGFGGSPFHLPALPNAAWFFGASEENYLSFKEQTLPEWSEAQSKGMPQTKSLFDSLSSTENYALATPPKDGGSAQRGGIAANGFLAQTFRSPKFHPLLIPAGLALPFSRKSTRRMLGEVIGEDGLQLWSGTARRQIPGSPKVDPTQWHNYGIKWREEQVSFEVDDALIFESAVSPNGPLGLVIWIDNQYAAFTPEGKIGFGVLENPEPAWLEIKAMDISPR